MRFSACVGVFLAGLLLSGCGGASGDEGAARARTSEPSPASERPAPAADRRPATPAESGRQRIIVLGDSLTAGLGLDLAASFPARLQARLQERGEAFEVVNAGVSGDTSAGGLRRLDWAMADGDPRILIVALGGNDGLRGLPPEQLESNLATIIERAQKRGLIVILAGMEAPPNFGADYTARFRAVYPTLAARYGIRLIPFLLEGVAGNAALNQPDGIHPNERGAALVADVVWKALEPAVAEARAAASSR